MHKTEKKTAKNVISKKLSDKKTKLSTSFINAKRFFKINFWRNNWSELVAIVLFILVHVALITYVLIIRASASVSAKFARVPGMLLNFTCALTILLILKRILTWIRTSHLGRKFSVLDGLLDFHKALGIYITILSFVHSFGHFFNFCKFLLIFISFR